MWNPFSKTGESKKHTGHVLDDDDREASKQTRMMKQQMQQMQMEIQQMRMERQLAREQMLLDELRGGSSNDDNDDDSGIQQMMMMALMNNMGGLGGQQPPTGMVPPAAALQAQQNVNLIHYSDEELMKVWNEIPRTQRKMLKVAPEALLRSKMREQFKADDDSIERALAIIRK